MVRLVGTLDRHAEVARLLAGELGQLHAERREMEPGHLLVEVLREHVDAGGVVVGLGEQLDLASTWLVKELDITNDGWPVALPRFISRPSESTMIELPPGKVHTSTCGLTFLRTTPSYDSRPAMSISLSKWPMLPTIAWCFIRVIWSTVTTSLLPVAVMMMSAVGSTSSRVETW